MSMAATGAADSSMAMMRKLLSSASTSSTCEPHKGLDDWDSVTTKALCRSALQSELESIHMAANSSMAMLRKLLSSASTSSNWTPDASRESIEDLDPEPEGA